MIIKNSEKKQCIIIRTLWHSMLSGKRLLYSMKYGVYRLPFPDHYDLKNSQDVVYSLAQDTDSDKVS